MVQGPGQGGQLPLLQELRDKIPHEAVLQRTLKKRRKDNSERQHPAVSCAPGGSGWNAPFVAASSTARRREINVAIAVTATTTSAPRSSDHNKAQKTGNAPHAKESTSANPSNLEQATCAACAGIIKRGHNRNKCAACSNEGHIKCSGGRRQDWLSRMCDTSQPQQPPRLRQNQDTLPTSKCKKCAGRINKGAPRATCRQCTKHFHYKCTSSTRSGQEHAHKEDWNCDACKAAKNPTTIPDIERDHQDA